MSDIKPWRVTASRHLIDDRWMRLRADSCVLPSGLEIAPYYVLEERDWVLVHACTDDGRVVVIDQYRHAAGVTCTELPGGIIDDGETPLAAAQRELREETGYSADEWIAAGSFHANPPRLDNRVHVFVARGLAGGPTRLDATEAIATALASPAQIDDAIATGHFSHALCIAACHLARGALARARASGNDTDS